MNDELRVARRHQSRLLPACFQGSVRRFARVAVQATLELSSCASSLVAICTFLPSPLIAPPHHPSHPYPAPPCLPPSSLNDKQRTQTTTIDRVKGSTRSQR